MLKIIVGILLIALSTLIGSVYTDKYVRRLKFYDMLSLMNSELKRNLFFKRNNIGEVVLNEKYEGLFGEIFLSRADDEKLSEILPAYLSVEEKRHIKEYFKCMGKGDLQSEKIFLEYNEEIIAANLKKCEQEQRKYKLLGEKMGFLFGCVGAVLII